MTNRILYAAQSGGPGRELADYVNAVQNALAKGRRLKAKLDSISFGSPGDWAAVAAEIGGITAAQAQDLWTIFSNAQAQLDAAPVAELARLDQGS